MHTIEQAIVKRWDMINLKQSDTINWKLWDLCAWNMHCFDLHSQRGLEQSKGIPQGSTHGRAPSFGSLDRINVLPAPQGHWPTWALIYVILIMSPRYRPPPTNWDHHSCPLVAHVFHLTQMCYTPLPYILEIPALLRQVQRDREFLVETVIPRRRGANVVEDELLTIQTMRITIVVMWQETYMNDFWILKWSQVPL